MDDGTKRPKTPEPMACSCGMVLPWEWWSGTSRMSARWTAPKVSPCASCADDPARQALREVRERLREAGFPGAAIGFQLDHGVLEQSVAQKEEAFQRSVRALFGQRLGVLASNRQALQALQSWRAPRWAVIHGAVGTGKTTLLSAMAWRLAKAPQARWEEVPGPARRLARVRATPVHYARVPDLLERRTHGAGALPGVLFLDDVGVHDPTPSEERRLVSDLLCQRADAGLPTVIAAASHDQLTDDSAIYGARVADRLRSALSVPLSGPSWRG